MRRQSKTSKPFVAAPEPALQSRPLRQRDARQPDLPFDPMPDRIEPCLAQLMPTVPSDASWLFEVKWDGYRLAVHIEPKGVQILTRGGHDWTHRFPAIAAGARALGVHRAILDGEACVFDAQGRSDFGALQQDLGGRGGKKISTNSVLMAFDLLYLDGHDLTRLDLTERRDLLEDLLRPGGDGPIRLSEEIDADGARFLDHACQLELEGIIAKRRDRPYRPGRNGDWLKIKCVQSESFAVVGYEASSIARGGLGGLLLAGRFGSQLVYIGSVGTGFSTKVATELKATIDRMRTSSPAVKLRGKNLVFTEPTLVAEVEFRGWTGDGKLRHASYKGLREGADEATVFDLSARDR